LGIHVFRIDRNMPSDVKRFAAAIVLMTGICALEAGSATWRSNPTSNIWDRAANWRPATVPYGEDDVATFGISNTPDILLADSVNGIDANHIVAEMVFAPGASSYTFTLSPAPVTYFPTILELHGTGITNNSGVVQTFAASNSSGVHDLPRIYFLESASAGENVVIINDGGDVEDYGASTLFWNNSSAAKATIINEGSMASGTIYGGSSVLLDYSSAESATFINNPGAVSGAAAGHTLIQTFLPGGTARYFHLHSQSRDSAWGGRRLGGNGCRHLRRHQLHRQRSYGGRLPGWPNLCLWC
jgi:hypothetical protein